MLCVVGLGNPGAEYVDSPHNAGFLVVDRLCRKYKLKLDKSCSNFIYTSFSLSSCDALLVKPVTYMNNSGMAVRELLERDICKPEEILIVYDDIDMPLSKIRIRKSGGAGTHNGMKSVIRETGSKDFKRVRVGIRNAETEEDIVSYVLNPVNHLLKKDFYCGIIRACNAVTALLHRDIDLVMNDFNRL